MPTLPTITPALTHQRTVEMELLADIAEGQTRHGADRARYRLIIRCDLVALRRARAVYTVAWREFMWAYAARNARAVQAQAAE